MRLADCIGRSREVALTSSRSKAPRFRYSSLGVGLIMTNEELRMATIPNPNPPTDPGPPPPAPPAPADPIPPTPSSGSFPASTEVVETDQSANSSREVAQTETAQHDSLRDQLRKSGLGDLEKRQ
jgi:hypothetical protein